MTVASFIKLFETVGIPVIAAAAAGYALWWLIKWITKNLKKELYNQHTASLKSIDQLRNEIDEEVRDTRDMISKQIKELNVIIIRLIDRVRVLEINFIEHDETVRTVYDLSRTERKKPRHEVVEELQEQIKDAGRTNGN
jgi:Fe2+ transport system protein B